MFYFEGPGHGIQLESGRLMFAANYFVKDEAGLSHSKYIVILIPLGF